MENNKNKKSVKFQGDMLNFCNFIQVFVFTRNHHLKSRKIEVSSMLKHLLVVTHPIFSNSKIMVTISKFE